MIDPKELEQLPSRLEEHTAEELRTDTLALTPWRADPGALLTDLARLAVEFANRSGGTILVGVESARKGKAAITGCPDTNLDELRRGIYALTEPAILAGVTTIEVAGKTLLAVDVPRGIPPHTLKVSGLAVAEPSAAPAAFVSTPEQDYSARVLEIGEEAIDPLEVERLRNCLQAKEMSSSLLRLPNNELLKSLGILAERPASSPDPGPAPRLTVAGLLLVGRENVLRQMLPGHEAIYLHMTKETEYDRRVDYHRPLLAVLDDLAQQLEPHNRIFTLKVGLFHFEIPDYPADVYREALLNAFMHRDYSRSNPIYLRLYSDRMEVSSPGGFLGGITPDNIMSHEPVTRNRLLAEILQRLRLVERSGMGVRRMYTILLASGKEPPLFTATPDYVRVVLRSSRTDEAFARFVAKRQQQGEEFNLPELIVLSYLKRNQEIDLAETMRILQRSSYEGHEVLGAMVERGLLEPFGQKKGRVYRLSRAVYVELRQSVEYHLHRDAEAAYAESAITGYIRENGPVTNLVVRTLLRVNRSQSSYILKRLVSAGKLVLIGHGRQSRYELPGKKA